MSSEAQERISELLKQAYAAVAEAETIADENNITFDFDVSYGMGGTYYPEATKWHEAGWVSSSSTC